MKWPLYSKMKWTPSLEIGGARYLNMRWTPYLGFITMEFSIFLMEMYTNNILFALIVKQLAIAAVSCFKLQGIIPRKKEVRVRYPQMLIDCTGTKESRRNLSCLKKTDTELRFPVNEAYFVFTDVIGSTKLYNDRPHWMKAQMDKHDAIAKSLVRLFNGHIIANEGDSFGLAFNSVYNATNFAMNFSHQLGDEGVELCVRIGMNYGKVTVANYSGYKAYGKTIDDLHKMFRHNCGDGQVCVSKKVLKKHEDIEFVNLFCKH